MMKTMVTITSVVASNLLKGTLSPKLIFSYIKDITFINTVHRVKNSLMPSFSFKIADQAEIVRVKGSEKQAIVSCNGSEK